MSALLLSLATFFSTLIGGLFGLRYRGHFNLILGFTAGVLVGLVFFDLLPEIFRPVYTLHLDSTGPMLAMVGDFLLFHIVEKSILIHFSHEEQVCCASASACLESFSPLSSRAWSERGGGRSDRFITFVFTTRPTLFLTPHVYAMPKV